MISPPGDFRSDSRFPGPADQERRSMTLEEDEALVDWLNKRFRKLGMKQPWYKWAVEITWEKLERWAQMLGRRQGERHG